MSRSALALATAKRWSSSDLSNNKCNAHGLSHKMRALLRETAQPVAVVTSFMPRPNPQAAPSPTTSYSAQSSSSSSSSSTPSRSPFHGATLSSFTPISMAPHHLVAFSLRLPSRMATTLADLARASAVAAAPSSPTAHMVINLLAAPQARAATLFSRPDLHARPFEDADIEWSLSRDGLPILHGSLGALSCRVVGAPWPLNDLTALGDQKSGDGAQGGGMCPQATAVGGDDAIRTLPLVYHRRSYTTTEEKLPLNMTNS
ncbi:flavin reductase like domain-containing protein [Russula earlei]|uniref:Flavin reductase like domain-containing protein n=1 Tax=Russula earlei TaxID=71964 RepID=A0ACC0UDH9_9AGAM|nr:flavin reductase like domain-containing protein [Russula earlei]